jgi:choline dehydrogenase-like flavoprotein
MQKSIWTALEAFVHYVTRGTGLFTSPVTEYTYLHQSDPATQSSLPDLELAWIGAWGTAETDPPNGDYGYNTILVQLPHPKSTGSIELVDRDARNQPKVDPAYLTAEEDLETLRKGVMHGMEIGKKMIESGYSMVEELVPKEDDVDGFIRRVVSGAYHLSSTCRMARREDGGVVDQLLQVYGVEGLRVADASVFPTLVGVKPQATIVMIGEKCADIILQGSSHLNK